MIKIKSIQIEEVRGIRNLTLDMDQNNFVVYGPNGSGKSGVVDAIQFALTGEIGRLKGMGTGDLSLSEHGSHVDKRDYPDDSFVHLEVEIPHLGKAASIRRKIKQPKNPTIRPDNEEVKAVFDNVAQHHEVILSRREIIKFILTEATQRSRDVQTLLKLDDIDTTRATLKTTENKLNTAYAHAKSKAMNSEDSLKRHLDLQELKIKDLLAAVNQRRKVLGLPTFTELKKDTALSEGVAESGEPGAVIGSKQTALSDIKAICEAITNGIDKSTKNAVAKVLENIAKTEAAPDLLASIKRRPFYESGVGLLDGDSCPFCDKEWDVNDLRNHLQEKLKKTEEAEKVRSALQNSGLILSQEADRIRGLLQALNKIAESDEELIKLVNGWSGNLLAFAEGLSTLEGIIASKDRLKTGWAAIPDNIETMLSVLRTAVKSRPDKSLTGQARDFLVIAQERLNNWRNDHRHEEEAKATASLGKIAYKTYCEVSEAALLSLYKDVEGDFGDYYQLINHDDEGDFKAKFEATEGKLELMVDFHKKGLFPPSAYHSEGHQDGMGVCLYLALMKRVLGGNFTLAVLDDVVMSVDSQHRKRFCKLLKTHFPETQFVITTHDQVWAKQMRTEGVVGAKNSIAFHTWTVDTGPVLDEIAEVWDQIDDDLAKNEVPTAAACLRRHLEYVAGDLADELGAKVAYRGDGGYDMGELLGAVIGRQGELLKIALKAANSWGNAEDVRKVEELQQARSSIVAEKDGEQWIVNKAVHYNEWANLSKEDFIPVVNAFKKLFLQFRCEKPNCDSWLSLNSRVNPTELRCDCGSFRLNLNQK